MVKIIENTIDKRKIYDILKSVIITIITQVQKNLKKFIYKKGD